MSVEEKKLADQIRYAQEQLSRLRRTPSEDTYPVGSVVVWTTKGWTYAACKQENGKWHTSAHGSSYEKTWEQLRTMFFKNALSVEIVVDAQSLIEEEQPPIEITTRRPEEYILTDTKSGVRWKRNGDRWIRLETLIEEVK